MTSATTAPICADALTARTPNNTTDDTTMEVIQMKFNYNKTRATINDKYQTAKWNARQSVQRTPATAKRNGKTQGRFFFRLS